MPFALLDVQVQKDSAGLTAKTNYSPIPSLTGDVLYYPKLTGPNAWLWWSKGRPGWFVFFLSCLALPRFFPVLSTQQPGDLLPPPSLTASSTHPFFRFTFP